ncbi:MAG: leucine-rich repeat protein [Bacilli bacterium]|nr:leucine-rich repeat protein [Bacilli bacterium]
MESNRIRTSVGVLATLSFFISIILINSNHHYLNAISVGSPYSLSLNGDNTFVNSDSPNDAYQSGSVNTPSGNSVSFKYLHGYVTGNEFITLDSGGTLTTTSSVMGISNVTVISSSTLKLEYGGNLIDISSGITYPISSNSFSLISFTNNNVISSVTINYSCSNSVYSFTKDGNNYILTSILDKSLTSYDVPLTYLNKPVLLSKGIFDGCDNMESLSITSLNGQSLGYYFKEGDQSTQYVTIASYLPSSLTDVTIKSGDIGDNALRECANIENLTLLDTGSIGRYALYNMRGLTNIYLNDGLTSIATASFNYLSELNDIFIPSTVTTILGTPFLSCGDSFTIRCASASKPAGWSNTWCGTYTDAVSWGQNR